MIDPRDALNWAGPPSDDNQAQRMAAIEARVIAEREAVRAVRPEAEAWVKRRDAFLAQLAALTMEMGIEIGGCGDCGSPWIEEMHTGNLADFLQWQGGEGRYIVGREDFDR